jgi:drug/metabolite transporter (DMT)-like permease
MTSPAERDQNAAVDPTSTMAELWLRATPAVFVLLWSTGFIGAKFGMPYAEPLTFLLLRFFSVTVILVTIALVVRAPWPRSRVQIGRVALVGVLIHGCYLGGVFVAISLGVPAGIAALLACLQPLLTAAVSGWYLGEPVGSRQWLGLAIGLAGVVLVVAEKLTLSADDLLGVLGTMVAVAGITAGTLYQKRHLGGVNLITGSAVQFAAVFLVYLVLAPVFETMEVEWTSSFVFALAWLTLVLSIGAITLFYLLIRRGAAAKVASLFYLVPSITALLAWLLFGETLGPLALVGMVLAALGVALVTRS